jgi:hypothetical protein
MQSLQEDDDKPVSCLHLHVNDLVTAIMLNNGLCNSSPDFASSLFA